MEIDLREMARLLKVPARGRPFGREGQRKVHLNTDSRTLTKNQVYWALRGDRFDGHQFVEECFRKGARAAVVDRSWLAKNPMPGRLIFPVRNTNKELGEFARSYARKFSIPKIAITGSNGKTTTKDMVVAVLSKSGAVQGTRANLNNQFGVPFTLFGLKRKHRYLVVEMGTNHPGEIAALSRIVGAKIGVITNVGYNHVEFLGSMEGVFHEKKSIVSGLSKPSVTLINADDPLLFKMRSSPSNRIVSFGIDRGMLRPSSLEYDEVGRASFELEGITAHLNVPGEHNVYNALAAIGVGLQLRIAKNKIAAALNGYQSGGRRMEYKKIDDIHLFDDCYNASPASLEAALKILSQSALAPLRVAVLGDMLELGSQSATLHYRMGKLAGKMPIDFILTFGKVSRHIGEGAVSSGFSPARVRHFENVDKLRGSLDHLLKRGGVVLVKGSRGMRLERVSDFITGGRRG